MANEFELVIENSPDPKDIQSLDHALHIFNSNQTGIDDARHLAIFIRDKQGQILAGLSGMTFYGWLAVDQLWVREDLRGQGVGGRLLQAAEAEAIARGCAQVQLDTFDFQAIEFYRKRGYQVFGVLEGYAGTHKRYYLRKNLQDARS